MKYITLFGFLVFAQWAGAQDFQVVSNCAESDYVMADVESSIQFQGMGYTPKCLKVAVGSTVTIAASGHHPLAPQPQAGNPIGETEQTQAFTFNQAGFFGYFCDRHGDANGNGMAGTIWVVESL